MNYHEFTFSWDINSKDIFVTKVLDWIEQFSTFVFLDSNQYPDPYGQYELLVAVDVYESFDDLKDLPTNTWLFGHHEFPSAGKTKNTDWQTCFFFQPKVVIAIPRNTNTATIYSLSAHPEQILVDIEQNKNLKQSLFFFENFEEGQWYLNPKAYQQSVETIQQWIQEGRCEELNLCVEYAWKESIPHPNELFFQINKGNPCPFSFYYKKAHLYAFSTSPERFFSLRNNLLRTQPIKGTIKRGQSSIEDEVLKEQLLKDPKERFENETITHMVFHELKEMSMLPDVEIVEAMSLHTFPTLHHLISTIEATFEQQPTIDEIFSSLFPMGSMTGYPKEEVLALTHEIEATERGLYSGTIGYQNPEGHWDFNVVIRTLIYNANKELCSFHTGGAITSMTNADREWQEIQLKASFFKESLVRNY